ncbi:MAG: hypothetical protein JWQ90_5086 [Hydrocarboniphaga sp.]|uniref:DUF2062 domain-containing protein n=1 Tax=Hydrocarboniphaga sp. TaxID=2033016 RepID=UPI00260ECA70|nr:DUF2062 domain-containing protein [Hydrocarboniphaga sp.]MDB5972636.1 hypothetical protein [Hydrocarboniphaga sp.]
MVIEQLRRGITPHQLALTFAVASVLSLFPVLGTTTLLCIIVGTLMKLNHPLMQLVNYLMTGLQLLLLLPLWKAGEWLGAPHLSLSFEELKTRFDAAPWQSTRDFGEILLGGIGIWVLCAPVWIALVYAIMRPLLTHLAERRRLTAGSRSPL